MGIFSEIKNQYQDVQDKLAIVQDEAAKAQKVGESIQRSVSEFQFAAQGHLDKINEIANKYQKS